MSTGPAGGDERRGEPRDERLARIIFESAARVKSGQPIDLRSVYAEHAGLLPELQLAMELLGGSSSSLGPAPGLEALGGHRILREIGRGGMGVVHEAVDLSLGRRVALKVLPLPTFADAAHRDRFLREARTTARLHHTSIVPVFEVGEEGGVLYYTMQYIVGRSLDRVIRALARAAGRCPEDGRPREAEDEAANDIAALLKGGEGVPGGGRPYHRSVARLGLEVAGALAHAHRGGVVHRDVKPSNLILDGRGTVWLTDFGLAKSELDSSGLTLSGDVVGTVAYMAPERFEGRGDAKCDVYSLGATLYEMLALKPAFHDSDRRRLIRRVTSEEPAPLRRIDREVPRDLETIVLKAMARDPAHRYGSAEELEVELGRFLRGEAIAARRARPFERAVRWCRKEPLIASLICAVAVLLLILLAVSVRSTVELRRRLLVAEMSNARALLAGGRPGRRFESLAAIARAARLKPDEAQRAELRDEAISALTSADLREVIRRPEAASRDGTLVFDADLERYAVIDGVQVVVRRTSDGAELRRIDAGGTQGIHGFSPDGHLLAVRGRDGERRRLIIFKLEDGSTHYLRETGGDDAVLAFDPGGGRAFIGQDDGSIVVIDLASGTLTALGRLRSRADMLRISPDGRSILAQPSRGQALEVLESAGGRRLSSIVLDAPAADAAWSPDGRVIATVSPGDGRVRLWDARTGDRFRALEGHLGSALRTKFSPGGELLASTSWDGTLRLWDPWSGDLLLTTTTPGLPLAFARGGGRLASIGDDLVVFEVAAGVERRVLRSLSAPSATGAHGLCIDPAGRLLISSWALWDLAAGRVLNESDRWTRGQWLFHPRERALLAGLGGRPLRRPFEILPEAAGDVLRWGRWQRLPAPLDRIGRIAADAAGRRLVTVDIGSAVAVLDVEDWKVRALGTHPGADLISVSPDGRWAASGTYNRGAGVKIWDLEAGRLIEERGGARVARAAFSPSGRWLAISTPKEFRVEEVEGWTPRRSFPREVDTGLPGPFAWSPDGKIIAIGITLSDVLLLDADTGRVAGRLGSAQPREAQSFLFSPDGERLIIGRASADIEVWDLGKIRIGLAAMGLDFVGERPAPQEPPPPIKPLRMEGLGEEDAPPDDDESPAAEEAGRPRDLADHVRLCARLQRGGKWKEAIRCFEEALERSPGSSEVLNGLAWALATGPAEVRDPRRAMELAEAAVRSDPRPSFLNTLGVAQYRAERFGGAVDTLLRGAGAAGEVTAWDGLFIAMALERQGLHALAADYFGSAVRWIERHPDLAKEEARELRRFREEAEGVLGAASR